MTADYAAMLTTVIGGVVQFVIALAALLVVFRFTFAPRNRWRIYLKGWRRRQLPEWWLRMWRADRESVVLQERRVLLGGGGIRLSPAAYLAGRRAILTLLPLIACLAHEGGKAGVVPPSVEWKALAALVIAEIVLWCDRIWLQSLRQFRKDRIRKEIVAVGSQLLYYTGSRHHLHGKLMKCLPLTRLIRGELALLLNEWYHDADRALRRFKERLGTEEAYGFAEILRSLRLNESDDIYGMLREIVRDYKAQIVLAKDSRKETASYLLFVMAGVPILYTFQIFLHPWVQEAGYLFKVLNP